MEYIIIALLGAVCVFLAVKVYLMRKSCREITEKLDMIMSEGTNNLVSSHSGDKEMKRLVSELNKKLKQIRKEQLRYLNGDRELRDAITNISHDLRTPLTAIMGYLEVMKDTPKSEKMEQYLEIIKGRTIAMKTLTEELFTYSVVLSTGTAEPHETVVNKVLEDSIMNYYGALSEKGISAEADITETKIIRMLDENSLARVFSNLLNNALKYSNGDLKIALKEPCVITFSNTAELTQTQVEKLFDRFYTVETASGSTGLGLSIARTLVEQMGGSISASLSGSILTITIILYNKSKTGLPIGSPVFDFIHLFPSSQKTMPLADATLSESTPCVIGIFTVWSQSCIVSVRSPSPSVPSITASLSALASSGSDTDIVSLRSAIAAVTKPFFRRYETYSGG